MELVAAMIRAIASRTVSREEQGMFVGSQGVICFKCSPNINDTSSQIRMYVKFYTRAMGETTMISLLKNLLSERTTGSDDPPPHPDFLSWGCLRQCSGL